MKTAHAARHLSDLKALLTLSGENVFRLRALEKAIKSLRAFDLEVSEFIALKEPGIGPQLESQLLKLEKSGSFDGLSELRATLPETLKELSLVRGLGAKKIELLRNELDIQSIEDLEDSITNGTLSKVKGFGEKSISEMRSSISFIKENRGYFLIDTHEEVLDSLHEIAKHISSSRILQATKHSESKSEIFSHVSASLHSKSATSFVKEAKARNFKCVEQTTTTVKLSHPQLKIPILLTLVEKLPNPVSARLTKDSIQGVLHAHSSYSDGYFGLEDMAKACIERGYSYLGISDHSQSAGYANGLQPERVIQQHQEIDKLNSSLAPFKIIKGIESDILVDGSLDYPNSILANFDIVIASIHSRFELDIDSMTKRIITAIENPHTKILAHPSGRLLLQREGYELDYFSIFEAAARNKVLIEINANPKRLDLSCQLLPIAKEIGVRFCISPDAHNIPQIDYMRYGLMMAKKAGLEQSDIANYLSHQELLNTNGY